MIQSRPALNPLPHAAASNPDYLPFALARPLAACIGFARHHRIAVYADHCLGGPSAAFLTLTADPPVFFDVFPAVESQFLELGSFAVTNSFKPQLPASVKNVAALNDGATLSDEKRRYKPSA